MKIRARATGFALLTIAAVALAGCATSAGSPADAPAGDDVAAGTVPALSPDTEVEIVFESYNIGQAGVWEETINTLVDEFEQEHPNITVTPQAPSVALSGGNASTVASVQQQLLAGNPPDVAQLTFDTLDFTINQLKPPAVEDLFGTAAVEEHFGGEYPFHERAKPLADWDGKTYGVPYVFSTPLLWVNATALEKAGIDPATVDLSTWGDVAEVGAQLAEANGKPPLTVACATNVGNWCMQGIIRSNGGRVISEDRSTIEFGEEGAVGAVQMLRDLYDAGVLENADATAQYEGFARGESLMQVQTSVMQSTFQAAADAGGWELMAFPLPGFEGKATVPTNSGSALYIFSQDPAKQAAAWEFITHMTSPRAYELITAGIGYVPLRPGITEPGGPLAAWAAETPTLEPNLEQLDRLEGWQSYPGNSYVQIDDLLWSAIEQSVFFGADVERSLTEAAERAQGLVAN
ncbi:extracellular solute-binding protein [Microbacterium sp. NPDC096154]|uniref:extracellular solute-binding protein n=1 Tax=Microbacterium sp. NPDC096154 TaxID=3155549 RepID=UPI0033166ACB